MIFHTNFRISKLLNAKFLDIQKFGWKINKKCGPKFTVFRNGALSSKDCTKDCTKYFPSTLVFSIWEYKKI